MTEAKSPHAHHSRVRAAIDGVHKAHHALRTHHADVSAAELEARRARLEQQAEQAAQQ